MSSWTTVNSKPVEFVAGQTLTINLQGPDQSVIRKQKLAELELHERKRASYEQNAARRDASTEAAGKVLLASPPAAEDARLEAAMDILGNCQMGKNERLWATAIRELITHGKPALPKLIAKLDATEDNGTLRDLGFVLRGIGDPRAVPALIRAIPRLYPGGGSDCALRINDDPELTRFMLEHDNYPREYPRDDPDTFSYGRPIWEIMPALEKITGESHGWLELTFADHEGQGEGQDRLKRIAFLEHAQIWADWWSKNWQKYLSNEADAQLDMTRKMLAQRAESIAKMPHGKPHAEIPRGPNVVVGVGASNSLLRSFDEPQIGRLSQSFMDIDIGRLPQPSAKLLKNSPYNEPSKELLAWAGQGGVDLIIVKTKLPGSKQPVYAFMPLGMKVWRIENDCYDNLQQELRYGEKSDLGEPWDGLIAQIDKKNGEYDDTLTASYLFITKEGICGAIQIRPPVNSQLPIGMPAPSGGWQYRFVYENNPKE